MNTRTSIAQAEREPFVLESRKAAAPIVRLWLFRMLGRLMLMIPRPSTARPKRVPPFILESREAAAPIMRLWLLRMLVPLGGHKEFIAHVAERLERCEKIENSLPQLLSLEHRVEQEVNDEFVRKSALKKLSKVHRRGAKLCKAVRKNLAEDRIIQALGLEHWIEQKEKFDRKSALKELTQLHRAAEKELKNAKVPDLFANKLKQFAKLVNLSETDCRIIEFLMFFDTESPLACAFGNVVDPSNDLWNHQHQDIASIWPALLSVLLALPQDEICLSLGKNSALTKLGLCLPDELGLVKGK